MRVVVVDLLDCGNVKDDLYGDEPTRNLSDYCVEMVIMIRVGLEKIRVRYPRLSKQPSVKMSPRIDVVHTHRDLSAYFLQQRVSKSVQDPRVARQPPANSAKAQAYHPTKALRTVCHDPVIPLIRFIYFQQIKALHL